MHLRLILNEALISLESEEVNDTRSLIDSAQACPMSPEIKRSLKLAQTALFLGARNTAEIHLRHAVRLESTLV